MQNWTDEDTASLTPVHTAFLTRDRETLWIHAYSQPAMVVLTYPPVPLPDYDKGEQCGLVRELHVRRGDWGALAGRWFAEVKRHRDLGWTDRSGATAHVWSGDPWEIPSVLDSDRPAPF